MISFRLSNELDVIPKLNTNGLFTLEQSKYPVTNSQLVPLRLFYNKGSKEYEPVDAIDWSLFLGEQYNYIDDQLLSVLPTFINQIILNTEGVTSVDLTNAQIDIINGLSFKNICYTIDCTEFSV